METWSIRVRPTAVAYLVYFPLYTFAPMLAGCGIVAIEYPVAALATGHPTGTLPMWVLVAVLVAWIAATIPLLVLIRRIIAFFLDRARLRLTPHTLYLGRAEVPVRLDRVREAYFVSQHVFGRKYRVARREVFNVLLLVLDDGSLVPISPPPGQFTDLMPEMYAATTNVAQFMHAIVAIVGPTVVTDRPLPPQALPFLHPMESNRLHHPNQPPRSGFWWTLARRTWLI